MSDNIKSRAERRKRSEAERKKNKNNKPMNGKNIIKKVFLAGIILGFAILIGGGGLFAYYASSAPKLDEELLKDPLSSEFLDRNGNVFHKTGSEKREFVPYDEIPDAMREAILATEDVRFFSHHGMDFYRLGGAVLANFRSGFGSQGASTLTQQVIKNSFLKNDKNLKRKAQEAWLAFQLEREYDKKEIFEMYFNKILMSGNIHGIGTASEWFYGKKLNELQLHEMAMLAGLPQSPNGYNPFKNPERAEKRRNIVLGLMYQHKKITKEQMEEAQAIPVTSTLRSEDNRQANDNTKYPAFVDVVFDELEEEGLLDVLSEGVKIYTSLDPAAQQSVENALKSDIYANDKMQAGLTVLDTTTGGIVAVGGGRNFSTGFLNFATKEKRQPGSAMKPILDYGPAVEYLNWSTGQTLYDTEYNYQGTKNPQPVRNVDNKYKGAITMREALYNSRNVPAVKTYEEVGRGKAVDFAAKLGINLTNDFPSNALGGTGEFSTTEMAGAYAAFGNGGIYTKPHAINKIKFRDGTDRSLAPVPVAVMKDSTAYMVTDMLRDVLTVGTGNKRAAVKGLDIAGKTGTTNSAKDSWFVGYTTNYTIAAWGGYQNRAPMENFVGERYVPQDLFKQIISAISSGKETARFPRPASVEEATVLYQSEPLILASKTTPKNMKRTELFVRGTVPTEMAEEEVIVLDAPTDLHANYDAVSDVMTLNWSHVAPISEAIVGDVEFSVYGSVDGSEMKQLTKTKDSAVTFTGIEHGKTYTFNVIAKVDDLESVPGSVTLFIEMPDASGSDEGVDPGIDVGTPGDQGNGKGKDKDKDKDKGKGKDNGKTPDDGTPGDGEVDPSSDPVESDSSGDGNP